MNFLIISGNPKKDGLCYSLTEALSNGASSAGANVQILSTTTFERCQVCDEGWGICRSEHKCAFNHDDFNDTLNVIRDADGICFVSPVYWGEISESLKSFLDKLRRCQFGQNGILSGKPTLLAASPGGSGNGMVSCLSQLDNFCRHTNASIFDYIGVNRKNREYKLHTAYEAARTLVLSTIAEK